ncbi:hypothetical protein Droror1_Dr00024017 [Drosera rotundifolia]
MMRVIALLLLSSLLICSAVAQNPVMSLKKRWLTLSGEQPMVIARGGFSGLFPDSSESAFKVALPLGIKDTILYCDMQLTKDLVAFCQTELPLENSTTIAAVYPKGQKTYVVNGKPMQGWFAVDFTADQLLNNVALTQNILTRPSIFDEMFPPFTIDDLSAIPAPIWINVQYDTFFNQHKLSAVKYISQMGPKTLFYVSSPEIGFLKNVASLVDQKTVRLVLKFLEPETVEPTTKQTYGAILKNLALVKQYARGILVPKDYIWPVGKDMYLQPATTLVADAHKAGLEIYAYGFASDFPASYNYSYDPAAEYLQFINNAEFSVDGVMTDFPNTASEAIACLAHHQKFPRQKTGQALIITHNGASGDYAPCTDLAYEKAIYDGADIIDCSVQLTIDGVLFCSDSADLSKSTNALVMFMSLSTVIPEIQAQNGIFSFDLTWSQIQTLKPQLVSPLQNGLPRNPAYKDKGRLLTLTEFLDLAKVKAVSGVLIDIQNAVYLAGKKNLDITASVRAALSNATFDKQSTQQVLIQSDDTSVLAKFKDIPTYKRVLFIEEIIGDAPKQPVQEIKKHADAVTVFRSSLMPSNAAGFTTVSTKVVDEMHAANISVYVSTLYNEYVALGFDYFADPLVEITTFVKGLHVDGVVTEYPLTASRYMRSPCSDPSSKPRTDKFQVTFLPVEPGAVYSIAPDDARPPAAAPAPSLEVSDVVDPPLPEVTNAPPQGAPAPSQKKSSSTANVASVGLVILASLVLGVLTIEC